MGEKQSLVKGATICHIEFCSVIQHTGFMSECFVILGKKLNIKYDSPKRPK